MSRHKDSPEQNPLLLLGAFAAVAALLFLLLQVVRPDGDTEQATDLATATETTSTATEAEETKASAEPSLDLRPKLRDVQPGQLIRRKPKRERKPEGPVLAPPSDGRSGTGRVFGVLPTLDLPVGPPVTGQVTTSVANIPNRTSAGGFVSSVRTLTAGGSDFVFLNEVSARSLDGIRGAAPGYGAYRDPVNDGAQSMNNVVMWRTDRWTLIDAGRVKVVDNDRGFHSGRPFVWDRYATWAVLQRADGGIVSIVSTHMPTNPAKFPRQHGNPGESRVSRYARGMDVLVRLAGVLAQHGPVLVGGDMNSHPGQGSWTAAGKMTAAGFRYVKDQGVMYLFYQGGVELVGHRQVGVASDHPAIITTLDLNGQGPV